jgi:membrane-associated protease RseP (regulator of RpoE activity)
MGYLLGVLAIVIGVPVSVALHEIGHLLPAKRFGIKCTQYMVGFGRTLWSRRIGETEYGVKLIPLGGYVRMIGMYPPKAERAAGVASSGRWTAVIEQARADARAEVGPGDEDRQFYQRPVWQRVIVMLGGPTMNLLLAVLLIGGVVVGYGLAQETTTVGSVSKCVLPVNAPLSATCSATDRPAPAAAAGLLPGDRIVAFGGAPVTEWVQVRSLIRANAGQPVAVTVERDGQPVDLSITPIRDERPVLDADGNPVRGADGKWLTEPTGFAGIGPKIETVPQPVTAVPGIIWTQVSSAVELIGDFPAKMVGVAKAVVGLQERDPTSPVSVVGVGRAAGEVASGEGISEGLSVSSRIASLVLLLGGLNLALFVLNLVPLLPLDGGHVAGALWEGLRRSAAKLLRRPDPGPVDTVRALPLIYAVGTVLIAMGALLVVADLVSPVKLTSG